MNELALFAGAGGVKLDWYATWRNWVRSQSSPKTFAKNFEKIFGNGSVVTEEEYEEAVDEEDDICSGCSGSGEGMYDGSNCYKCGGSGIEPVEKDDDV